jgi:streptogramin lyase
MLGTSARIDRVLFIGLCLLALVAVGDRGFAAAGKEVDRRVPRCFYTTIAPAGGRGALVLLCAQRKTLAHVLPNGNVQYRSAPGSGRSGGPIAVGPSGEVWVAHGAVYEGEAAGITRLTPNGGHQTTAVEASNEETRQLEFHGLVVDSQGTAWAATAERLDDGSFHSSYGGQLIRIDSTGAPTTFAVPEEIEPEGLAVDTDGNLWFTGIRGRESGEHFASPGTGYIGRMSPEGEFALFPVPAPSGEPEAIAVSHDGIIWFTEPSIARVGTIAPDGTFGHEYDLRSSIDNGYLGWRSELTLDHEGNAWLSVAHGLLRMTPRGQQTVYPGRNEGSSVMTGREGAIWWLFYNRLRRIETGEPGLDIWGIAVDRPSRTVSVRVACGGSTLGCKGNLKLALRFHNESATTPKAIRELPPFRLVDTTYSLPAESVRTLTLKIPGRAFALAKRYEKGRLSNRWGYGVIASATVVGGPPLQRRIKVPEPGT